VISKVALNKVLAVAVFVSSASTVYAGIIAPPATTQDDEAALFLGLTFTLGGAESNAGKPGISLKIFSTNKRDAAAAVAGVTYNFDGSFGCDLGLGYNMSDISLTTSYDFCASGVQFGLGGTNKPDSTPAAGPVFLPGG
jgi:hypothetical protein